MNEVFYEIAKLGIVFSIMCVIIYYLYHREKKLLKELKEVRDENTILSQKCSNCPKQAKLTSEIFDLNKILRESEKDNLVIISKLSDVIDKISDKLDFNHEYIKEHLISIKELIKDKMDEIKNKK